MLGAPLGAPFGGVLMSGATAGTLAPGANLTGTGSFTGGAATVVDNSVHAPGASLSGSGAVAGGAATSTASAPGASMSGVGSVNGGGASGDRSDLSPLPANPRMLYVAGKRASFSPMRVSEVEVLTIDFGPILAPGESIVSAVWSNSVSHGTDPNPTAMIQNRCTISGRKVSELFAAHVPGVTYAPSCKVITSSGQTLIQPEFDYGLLYVTP